MEPEIAHRSSQGKEKQITILRLILATMMAALGFPAFPVEDTSPGYVEDTRAILDFVLAMDNVARRNDGEMVNRW